jgi:hypothetical protein
MYTAFAVPVFETVDVGIENNLSGCLNVAGCFYFVALFGSEARQSLSLNNLLLSENVLQA